MLNRERFSTGIAMWRSPSQVRKDHGTPNSIAVCPRPVLGSQPSCTANTMMNINPTQNVGSENPRMEPAMMAREPKESGFSPAYRPKGMPTTMDNSTAVIASSNVAGMRCAISRRDGSLKTKLRPMSPCSAPFKNTQYCSHSGLSSPSAAIARARSA